MPIDQVNGSNVYTVAEVLALRALEPEAWRIRLANRKVRFYHADGSHSDYQAEQVDAGLRKPGWFAEPVRE